jgi:hypothetical protein
LSADGNAAMAFFVVAQKAENPCNHRSNLTALQMRTSPRFSFPQGAGKMARGLLMPRRVAVIGRRRIANAALSGQLITNANGCF